MRNLAVIALLLGAMACNKAGKVPKKVLQVSYISVEAMPCFGTCPQYELQIFHDGTMVLEGKRNVEIGNFAAQLDHSAHVSMVSKMHGINWDTIQAQYITGYSDLPYTILKYSETPGDTFHVQFESAAAPAILKDFAHSIDSLRKHTEWRATTAY